jgi:hypothetical protein
MSDKPSPGPTPTEALLLEAVNALKTMSEANAALLKRLDSIDGKSQDEVRLEQMRNRLNVPGWNTPKLANVVSERTSCLIDVILASEKPGAKVLAITNVRLPKGSDQNVKFGGIVPDGLQIFATKDGVSPRLNVDGLDESTVMAMNEGMYTKEYREWRFGALLQPDRLEYVGKPLPPRMFPKTAS